MSFLAVLKFFASPYGLMLVAVIGAVGFMAVVYHKGETAGGAAVEKKVQVITQKTQKRIDDAEAHGPRTSRDVSKRMRDGTF